MKRSSTRICAAALPLFAMLSTVLAPTPGPYTDQGCFSSSSGMTSIGDYMYQSPGWCSDSCKGQGKAVAGTTKGKNCWCGDKLPSASSKTSDSSCNEPCTGFGDLSCGGSSAWSVYLTGLDDNPGSVSSSNSNSNSNSNANSNSNSNDDSNSESDSNNEPVADTRKTSSTSSSTPTPTTTTAPAKKDKAEASVVTRASTIVVTAPGQSQAKTTVVTTTQTAEPSDDGGSKPNVAGIAAGVVVGVVALIAVAAGLFFFLRNRKRKQLEEEHQRNITTNSYTTLRPATSSAGSVSDSRLEPSVMMQRRQSDGSIADNQDYSRRILKVTNY